MQTIVSFILLISFLVFFHELGHFIFAKRAGILVREFAIGFGPKLFSRFKGETLYSLRILPLGGYVRMAGEDPEIIELKTGSRLVLDRDEQGRVVRIHSSKPDHPGAGPRDETLREYGEDVTEADLPEHLPPVHSTKAGKLLKCDLEKDLFVLLEDENGREVRYHLHPRAVIRYDENHIVQIAPIDRQFHSKTVLQRALTIVAGPLFNLILTVVLLTGIAMAVGVEDKVLIHDVVPDSPAEQAGLQPGDALREVNGEPVKNFTEAGTLIGESGGNSVTLKMARDGQVFETEIQPNRENRIGIEMRQGMREASLSESIAAGFSKTYDLAALMGDFLSRLITGQAGMEQLSGPVGIANVTGKAAEAGWVPLVHLAAVLSLNLGILNILPFPMLDGGRLVFIMVEGIRGRPIDPGKEGVVHFIGFALLMLLMLLVTYNDIVRLFKG
ncbi:RIP metalloprotease RseP [Paludifilum halophilum]|uniref:Zinc metalloprotease n=1 Tax=Paludifilum halophilum TaxID=1642702 RepID=A0A235BCF1_9BACL|nr:RIP metalloprotease RseP [Paludifilum halophilum]